ncbi:MAG: serine protease [Ignisphaera sp.]
MPRIKPINDAITFSHISLKSLEDSIKAVIHSILESIVIVMVGKDACINGQANYDFDGSVATGFYVDRDIILSAYHVIKKFGNRDNLCILTFDGDFSKASIVADDEDNDIVFLAVEKNGRPLNVRDSIADIGSIVLSTGFAYGLLRHFITYGFVSGLDVKASVDGTEIEGLMLLNMPILPGMSGAPIVDIYGKVAGMVISRSILFNELSLATPSTRILRDLLMFKKFGKVVTVKLGLKLLQSTSLLKNLKAENGVIVVDILNKKLVDICQVNIGDILIEANNVKINSIEDLRNIVASAVINNSAIYLQFKSPNNGFIKQCVIDVNMLIT